MNHVYQKVIATWVISWVGKCGCMHHGMPIDKDWYHVQLPGIVEGKGQVRLQVPNFNDDLPQLKLKDVMGTNVVWGAQFL